MITPVRKRTKIFISYSHDSDEHVDRVLALADRLSQDNIHVILDRYVHPAPEEAWPLWMETNLEAADFVLLICTEIYRRRVVGQETQGIGLGVRWEGNLIRNHLYNDALQGSRYIPILLEGSDVKHIPTPVLGHQRYTIRQFDLSDKGYEGLYRHLTSQPSTPPLGSEEGNIVRLPPHPRRGSTCPPPAPPQPAAVTRIKPQIDELRQLIGYIENSRNTTAADERFDKWRKRTANVIESCLSRKESDPLYISPTRNLDRKSELINEAKRCLAYLERLTKNLSQ